MSLLLRARVAKAAARIVPSWPAHSFIAVNPWSGEERRPFEEASARGAVITRTAAAYAADIRSGRIRRDDIRAAVRERLPELARLDPLAISGKQFYADFLVATELELELELASHGADTPITPRRALDRVDHLVSKWVAAFLDPDPLWPMPHRDEGLYVAWRRSLPHDPELARLDRQRIEALPLPADAALDTALRTLGIEDADVDERLRSELEQLPGWVSHLKWRADHVGDLDLTSYLAMRFSLRMVFGDRAELPRSGPDAPAARSTAAERATALHRALSNGGAADHELAAVARLLDLHPVDTHLITAQRAYELHYRAELIGSLRDTSASRLRPDVQVVMCIDPRSEGMRRGLEADPRIETLGFAGFFGVPMRFIEHSARGSVDSLPALLSPHHTVTELPTDARHARRRTLALRARDAARQSIHSSDHMTAAPFAFAEIAGWFVGIASAARTLAPGWSARIRRSIDRAQLPEAQTDVTATMAFSLEDRIAMAEAGIRMMGLDRFAPLILLAGHRSTSTNNMFESALDCGACGGNPGGPNARAAAAILNDQEVRAALAYRGVAISTDTVFVAAEHDTVSDRMSILDEHRVPPSHRARLARFVAAQKRAADVLVRERSASLPGASSRSRLARVRHRAHDWAEVYPELGLAGNAAMVVGPREMTRDVDLERRVFLHSYRPELDPDGRALENILTAPLVVAQWINHQYYFSSIDPDRFGAGTKTNHNAIGDIGVLTGQSGDLRRGLPWQSVAMGETLLHEPLRLTVVVQAPLDRISVIVSRNQVLRDLFDNGWISLAARSEARAPWYTWGQYGWAPLADIRIPAAASAADTSAPAGRAPEATADMPTPADLLAPAETLAPADIRTPA